MKVFVAGLGTIGIKLVEYLAGHELEVVAYNWRNVDQKRELLLKRLERKFDPAESNTAAEVFGRIEFTDSLDPLAGCEIIIEALLEDYDTKTSFYESVEAADTNVGLIATTTSSLSLQRLSISIKSSDFVGLHVFNPPNKMQLIELSYLECSAQGKEILNRLLSLLSDKTVIELPPVQGYIVNSILFAHINFAMKFSSSHGIKHDQVDLAMKLGTNVPMGPFELSDFVGNDVTLEILEELFRATGDDTYKPAPILVDMVRKGSLGRKTHSGFYDYQRK